MKNRLAATQSQSQSLNAQVLQSIRLLGLTGLELEQELAEALAQNPMLEREEDESEASLPELTPQERAAQETAAFDELPDLWSTPGMASGFDPEEGEDRLSRVAAPVSNDPALRVLEGLAMELKDADLAIAAAWLERTADSGYLAGDRDAIDADITAALGLRKGRAEAIRQRLLHGTPAGLAAVDLRECLLAQIHDLPAKDAGVVLARDMIDRSLALVAQRDWPALAAVHGAPMEALRVAARLIQSLNPKPGEPLLADEQVHVLPDVVAWPADGRWHVALNPQTAPRVRVASEYESALSEAGDSPSVQHLKALMNEARWLARGIAQRHDTLIKVARAVVARQQAFLERGEEGLLPLTLKEIAADVGVHESTVSRITTGKYLQTPRGLFELKRFFGVKLEGSAIAGVAIRALVKKLIDAELPASPLADDVLVALLARRGVQVARRTVAKYREQLNIPPARQRGLAARAA
ncbi:RNA polymerase factor sigma-54 [Silanimonas sp.]|jgi:RNA polymerase sigma-54 factor|uniref:RNA polymerase factor sigma-54 n=1 Tax=Silanimonas sp. TaxID=1929290 RepID=UPI0022BB708E|nr:RNA polymerase factor sigma-54 [Silanimonas sp.]MCZ8166416.1 RNA polymerase factor sigma-54 [Silanimonas sp.]